jgi:hypothetical protein
MENWMYKVNQTKIFYFKLRKLETMHVLFYILNQIIIYLISTKAHGKEKILKEEKAGAMRDDNLVVQLAPLN